MRVKYNRVSTIQQTGDRFTSDTEHYDLVLLDKVSGSVSFDEREQGKKLFNLIKEGKVSFTTKQKKCFDGSSKQVKMVHVK